MTYSECMIWSIWRSTLVVSNTADDVPLVVFGTGHGPFDLRCAHPISLARLQLEQDRHRAVVDQFDLHVGTEDTGFHVSTQLSQRLHKRG